ncbi:50S ribosomal protein L34e [Candidatus Micrarchaeota archaeon]|nr:50S ribosomal protein L34e [Candidatus Micrarchaeota archaeon]
MASPKNRSNSVRKVKRRTPQGTTTIYKRRVKGKKHSCAVCKGKLHATHSLPSLAKSSRHPSRIYGGNLCHLCAKKAIIFSQRIKDGSMQQTEVEILLLPYVKPLLQK